MLKIKLTLRVFSEHHTLSELSQALGEPDKGFSIGDEYGKPNKKREATLWSKKTSLAETETLELHIGEMISLISAKSQDLDPLRQSCKLDFFCMLRSDNGQGGTSLSPQIMGELNRHGIGITFDIYCDE